MIRNLSLLLTLTVYHMNGVREGTAWTDEENLEGNDLMEDAILYLQKNLSCGAR